MYIYDPPIRQGPGWQSSYGRARRGVTICGAEMIDGFPDLVCTRPMGHRNDFHVAHTATGEEICEDIPTCIPAKLVSDASGQAWTQPYPVNVFNMGTAVNQPPAQQSPAHPTAPTPPTSTLKSRPIPNPYEGWVDEFDLLPDAD